MQHQRQRLIFSLNPIFESFEFPVIITRSSNNFGANQYPEKLIPLMILNMKKEKHFQFMETG